MSQYEPSCVTSQTDPTRPDPTRPHRTRPDRTGPGPTQGDWPAPRGCRVRCTVLAVRPPAATAAGEAPASRPEQLGASVRTSPYVSVPFRLCRNKNGKIKLLHQTAAQQLLQNVLFRKNDHHPKVRECPSLVAAKAEFAQCRTCLLQAASGASDSTITVGQWTGA